MNLGMTPQYGAQSGQNTDVTAKVDGFLKVVTDTLDKKYNNETPEFYKTSIVPQLVAQPRIIINGQPFGSKAQFQELWSQLPQTQHTVNSFDTHLLPTQGERQYVILAHLKVRFDESGTNRFGAKAELLPQPNNRPSRASWSNQFGVCLTLVVSEQLNTGYDRECVSSFDYRITESPENSIFAI